MEDGLATKDSSFLVDQLYLIHIKEGIKQYKDNLQEGAVTNMESQKNWQNLTRININALLGYIWQVLTKWCKWMLTIQANGQEINRE